MVKLKTANENLDIFKKDFAFVQHLINSTEEDKLAQTEREELEFKIKIA